LQIKNLEQERGSQGLIYRCQERKKAARRKLRGGVASTTHRQKERVCNIRQNGGERIREKEQKKGLRKKRPTISIPVFPQKGRTGLIFGFRQKGAAAIEVWEGGGGGGFG